MRLNGPHFAYFREIVWPTQQAEIQELLFTEIEILEHLSQLDLRDGFIFEIKASEKSGRSKRKRVNITAISCIYNSHFIHKCALCFSLARCFNHFNPH